MNADLVDLGTMAYLECTALQGQLLDRVASEEAPNTLLFVQHPPVLTLGANFHGRNLLLSREEYAHRGIAVFETERGGDVTYHGPGQLVIYPIFRVSEFGRDLHIWLRDLEETILLTTSRFEIEGRRFPPHTGVWVGDRKIAAIGIKVRRWTSMHGVALNCDGELSAFETIVPCGIEGYGVTSLTRETSRPVTVADASEVVAESFEKVFGLRLNRKESVA